MSRNPRRVLLASVGALERGGLQRVLQTWLCHVSKEDIEYTWYFAGIIRDESYYDELKGTGVRLIAGGHRIDPQAGNRLANVCAFYRGVCDDIAKILTEGRYDVLHVNSSGVGFAALTSRMAKKHGIALRIAHSHSSELLQDKVWKKALHAPLRMALNRFTVRFAACSRLAAEAAFGAKRAREAVIVPNYINAERFAYSDAKREACRRKYGLEDCFVIGHVGRLSEEKNQGFLMEALRELLPRESSARLLLVGSGPMEDQLRARAAELGLADKIVFAGATNAPQDFYSAMDVFVLPSAFEGFPLVGVEAQANGLPCLLSDGVPDESRLTDLVSFLPLAAGTEAWTKRILEMRAECTGRERRDAWREIVRAGYDTSNIPQMMAELYDAEIVSGGGLDSV